MTLVLDRQKYPYSLHVERYGFVGVPLAESK
jgi:hypothetical protein